MDAGIITAIVGGATQLTTSLVSFGGQVYAVDNTPLPVADEFNYNIIVPPTEEKSAITPSVIALIVTMFLILIITGFLLYKFS